MNKPLASMTGYARAGGSAQACSFQIELKSVNARGMDIRMRLAPGLDALEPELRRRINNALARGSIALNITLQRESSGAEIVINQQALGAVLDALDALAGRIEADRPRLDGVLALKGVLETRETPLSADAEDVLGNAILEALDTCLDDLLESRRVEGDRLTSVLIERIEEIEALTEQAENHPSRTRDAIMERLRQQIEDLNEAGNGLSEERLHQEAMLLATKADIREELDRLKAHVKSARQLIGNGGPVGRKLDFLSQEFNREANTLCSKSNAVDLTAIGLDLKASIDQLREQVQTIE
jgi:uncharacterized protein (TIGR00255 family)